MDWSSLIKQRPGNLRHNHYHCIKCSRNALANITFDKRNIRLPTCTYHNIAYIICLDDVGVDVSACCLHRTQTYRVCQSYTYITSTMHVISHPRSSNASSNPSIRRMLYLPFKGFTNNAHTYMQFIWGRWCLMALNGKHCSKIRYALFLWPIWICICQTPARHIRCNRRCLRTQILCYGSKMRDFVRALISTTTSPT